jgi:hypothetical protein
MQSRAAQYLPILSPAALADRDFMDRCGAASARDDLMLPCWSAPLSGALKGARLGRIHPARFDSSWSDGLRDVLARLNAKGVKQHHSKESGRAIALRAFIPEPVVSATPERVFANVFRATVPPSILICKLDRPLQHAEADTFRRQWAFVEADSTTLLSFEEPSTGVPLMKVRRLPEYSWEDCDKREGKRSADVVINRSVVKATHR